MSLLSRSVSSQAGMDGHDLCTDPDTVRGKQDQHADGRNNDGRGHSEKGPENRCLVISTRTCDVYKHAVWRMGYL